MDNKRPETMERINTKELADVVEPEKNVKLSVLNSFVYLKRKQENRRVLSSLHRVLLT